MFAGKYRAITSTLSPIGGAIHALRAPQIDSPSHTNEITVNTNPIAGSLYAIALSGDARGVSMIVMMLNVIVISAPIIMMLSNEHAIGVSR